MPKVNTRDRLLDAAEQLVAHQGYASTSLREITAKAEANLAAVNYHFGSKEKLVAEMLARRIEPLNDKRLHLLETELSAARKEGRRPDGKALLRAFIEPAIIFLRSQDGGINFMKMFSRIHSDPDDTVRRVFLSHMVPVFMRFFKAFQQALPQVEPQKLAPRLLFCIGAMGHGAGMLVDEHFSKHGPQIGLPPLPDSDALVDELIGFAARGMEVA